MISEPASRISACSRPTALVSASSERKELEQTSSARPSVLCASVPRTGRISCSTTGTPACAACHAASEPARPPPMMWMGLLLMSAGIVAWVGTIAIAAGAEPDRGEAGLAKQQHPPGEEIRRVSFWWPTSGGGEERPYSSAPGRRSALTKFLSLDLEGARLPLENNARRGRRCGGRRFAGQPREEVSADLSVKAGEEVDPGEIR